MWWKRRNKHMQMKCSYFWMKWHLLSQSLEKVCWEKSSSEHFRTLVTQLRALLMLQWCHPSVCEWHLEGSTEVLAWLQSVANNQNSHLQVRECNCYHHFRKLLEILKLNVSTCYECALPLPRYVHIWKTSKVVNQRISSNICTVVPFVTLIIAHYLPVLSNGKYS